MTGAIDGVLRTVYGPALRFFSRRRWSPQRWAAVLVWLATGAYLAAQFDHAEGNPLLITFALFVAYTMWSMVRAEVRRAEAAPPMTLVHPDDRALPVVIRLLWSLSLVAAPVAFFTEGAWEAVLELMQSLFPLALYLAVEHHGPPPERLRDRVRAFVDSLRPSPSMAPA